MPRFPQRIWLAAFLFAWAVDFLFWGKPAGISFLVFVGIALAVGFGLSKIENVRPALFSVILSAAVLVLAGLTLLRSAPMARFLNGFLTLIGLALLARTFRTGGWIRFDVVSYLAMWIDLLAAMLSRAAGLPLFPKGENGSASLRTGLQRAAPVFRGVLLALPVLILLAALLASADLVFADQINQIMKEFNVARLPEYIFRFFLVLSMTYLLAGIYSQVLVPRKWAINLPGDEQEEQGQAELAHSAASTPDTVEANIMNDAQEGQITPGAAQRQGKPVKGSRFLGPIEAFIVLGSVNLLFTFFVAIQFRYLFGGQVNITMTGYTFSEYARRGFFELVSVAVISLMLYLALNAITKRSSRSQEWIFTGLSGLLVSLVLFILFSAFQRLLLYEGAYGFTRLRMYTHIFIPWLGLLLVGAIVLQILGRDRFFGILLLTTVFGFCLSFGVLNVDGMIARLNIERARTGAELDGYYLIELSDDVLPVLVESYQQSERSDELRDLLGSALACRVYRISLEQEKSWQSYHPGQAAARQLLLSVDLKEYHLHQSGRSVSVLLDDGPFYCSAAEDYFD